jgi:hypothetical protein
MKYFLKDEDKDEVDLEKYANAESNVSAELRSYLPCFNRNSEGLNRIWASIFNFTFIGLANEKNENGFSQITVNYNKALEWLESEEAKQYCNSKPDSEIDATDFIKIGQKNQDSIFSKS